MVKIIECKCDHKWQDETYGIGKRVFNSAKKVKEGLYTYICTVCLNEIDK